MAKTNLHESATQMLGCLMRASVDGRFEGKLRTVQAEAGLSSGRSAEAVKLLEETGRIEIEQRGRRSRDTIILIRSTEPVTLEEAVAAMPEPATKTTRLNYEDIGRSVIDRLISLARDDALRAAQVEAFAGQAAQATSRIEELETALEQAAERETDLRMKLRAAEETLVRAEENLQKAFAPRGADRNNNDRSGEGDGGRVPDDDARAVLDILRARP